MGNLWTQLVIHSHEDCKVKIIKEEYADSVYRLTLGDNQLAIKGELDELQDIFVSGLDEITRIKEENRCQKKS